MKFNDVATYWEVGVFEGIARGTIPAPDGTVSKGGGATGADGTTSFGADGGRTYLPPRQVKVRWEDVNELFINSSGDEMISAAKVFMSEIPIVESYLVRGCFRSENPRTVAGAMRIKKVSRVGNIKGNKEVIVAWL